MAVESVSKNFPTKLLKIMRARKLLQNTNTNTEKRIQEPKLKKLAIKWQEKFIGNNKVVWLKVAVLRKKKNGILNQKENPLLINTNHGV